MTRRAEPPRRIDVPRAGFYQMRLTRKGPLVAARISHGRHGWSCSIGGQSTGFPNPDPFLVTDLWRVHSYGTLITEVAYLALASNPHPSPDRAIDLNQEKPAF